MHIMHGRTLRLESCTQPVLQTAACAREPLHSTCYTSCSCKSTAYYLRRLLYVVRGFTHHLSRLFLASFSRNICGRRLDSSVLFSLLLQTEFQSSRLFVPARQTRIFIGYGFQNQETLYLTVRKLASESCA